MGYSQFSFCVDLHDDICNLGFHRNTRDLFLATYNIPNLGFNLIQPDFKGFVVGQFPKSLDAAFFQFLQRLSRGIVIDGRHFIHAEDCLCFGYRAAGVSIQVDYLTLCQLAGAEANQMIYPGTVIFGCEVYLAILGVFDGVRIVDDGNGADRDAASSIDPGIIMAGASQLHTVGATISC